MPTLAPETTVRIPAGDAELEGNLFLPPGARSLVLFAHGSGSSRFSPRNRFVAAGLNHRRLGTLLLDLLTPAEERIDDRTGHLRFDIELLAARLAHAASWLAAQADTGQFPIGLFGASTGAAAALLAAASTDRFYAVVSRGGRPDLAGLSLAHVRAPTLLMVGSLDTLVIQLNEEAYSRLRCAREMKIVPGASHLFEEPGTLEQVTLLAAAWFVRWLPGSLL